MSNLIYGKGLFKRFQLLLLGLVMAGLVASCQTTPIPTPQTPNQKLAYGYALINTITQETISMYNDKKISKDTASKAYHSLVIAKSTLDTAAKYENDKATFDTYLSQAITLIQETSLLIGQPVNTTVKSNDNSTTGGK